MQKTYIDTHPNDYGDEIDLRQLFYILSAGKWNIVSVTAFVSIIGVIYSLSLPNLYESKALLAPVNSSNSIAGGLGGYSGLAGLAGINLSSGADDSNSAEAMQKIGSLSFFENNIITNIHLPDLMAVKSWNSKTNILAYDDNIYDKKTNTWIRKYSHPKQQIPSTQESFEVFKEEHLTLSEDKKSGFINLSIKHQSPYVAKQWTELVVSEINSFYRIKDKIESEKATSYLKKQIATTSFSEIKEALAELLQDETKKLTLIEANKFYVFDYIDTPAVMEKKTEPRRTLILIFSVLLGGIIGMMMVLIKHYFYGKKT